MTTNDGQVPVVDVDQVFPLLTSESATRSARSATPEGDQGSVVTAVLRDVLGWRPRPQDSRAFTAALTASFTLEHVEGHVESRYVPRGFAMQADLGAVSGGQASLYSRARSALTQMTVLLDGLTPLRTDADPEDCSAYRLLVRHAVGRLVDELGTPGGPRQPVVDSAFEVLAGAVAAGVTADDVPGQLGALRERFGLLDQNVNTVEEERVRTSFWTLVDLVLDLRRSWEDQKGVLAGQSGSGFLGTDLVLISRLLAAAAEQVDELEAVLDSVLVSASERQTLTLVDGSGLTLDGLLSWLRQFLTQDGPMYIRDSGRDGMRTAFTPTAQQLLERVHHDLLVPLGGGTDGPAGGAGTQRTLAGGLHVTHDGATGGAPQDGGEDGDGSVFPVRWLPASCGRNLPAGMFAARSRIAVAGLCRLLDELFTKSARIGRYPGVVLFEVQVQEIGRVGASGAGRLQNPDDPSLYVRITVRGANLRAAYLPALVREGNGTSVRDLQLPLNGSTTADENAASGIFRLDPDEVAGWDAAGGAGATWSLVLPAQLVPVTLVDGETGRVVAAPPTRTWPDFLPPPVEPVDELPDWSNVGDDRAFVPTGAGLRVPARSGNLNGGRR